MTSVAARAGRRGFTVVEALVALLLLAGLLQLAWGVAAAQRRSLVALSRRGDALAAERAVWWAVSSETAAGVAGRDWSVEGPGVLGLRAFRGRGVACGASPDAEGWIAVRYSGWRLPDPAKDSVLVLDDFGRWRAHDLAARVPDPEACALPGTASGERWRLVPPPVGGVTLGRIFERGSYHLEDRAFRYRRGAAGRQPLTAEVLDPEGSAFRTEGGRAAVRFRSGAVRIPGTGELSDTGWIRPLSGG